MAYSTAVCVGVTVAALVCTWLTTCLRGYVRCFIVRTPGLDDLFSLLTLTLFTVESVIYLFALLNYDIARHSSSRQTSGAMSKGVKLFFICEILFVFATGVIKISFAFTLLRVVQRKLHRTCLFAIIAIIGIISSISFAFVLTTCDPIETFWTQFVESSVQGTCKGLALQLKDSYAHGTVMLFVDVVLGLAIPVHLLADLHMPRRLKVSAGVLLSLGSFASIATTIRIYYSSKMNSTDFLYSANVPFFWGTLELSTSLVCTSASTLKPLFARISFLGISATYVEDHEHELDAAYPSSSPSSRFPRKGLSGGRGRSTSRQDSSTEEITWDGKDAKSRIQKSMSFDVDVKSGPKQSCYRKEAWEDASISWLAPG